jgi:hypothetical protein
VNTSSPWVRFVVAIVGVALAIRVAIDLVRPVFVYVLAAMAVVGTVVMVRWWCNRW